MSTNATATVPCDVKDLLLANEGKRRIEWAFHSMPVLQAIRKHFIKAQPLDGIRIAACLPLTAENANLLVTLRDGGARIGVCASDAAVTEDEVAASLVRDYTVPVFAISGVGDEVSAQHRCSVLNLDPQVVLEDGAQLTSMLLDGRDIANIIGAVERTASAAGRLALMARQDALGFPVVAASHCSTARLFDGMLGSGQSTLDAISRVTHRLIAGLTVVVAGYGCCGRGIAARARGLGASVVVTEVDPGKALEAIMDGYRVMAMQEAARIGDVFVTATGNRTVLARDHFDRLRDGAILSNAGSVHGEIDVETLGKMAVSRREVKEFVEEFKLKDGRRVHLLAGGRQINKVAGDGHPASVLDMAFAVEALSIEYLRIHAPALERKVHSVPEALNRQVGRMKLEVMGVTIDKLTVGQEEYLAGSSDGY